MKRTTFIKALLGIAVAPIVGAKLLEESNVEIKPITKVQEVYKTKNAIDKSKFFAEFPLTPKEVFDGRKPNRFLLDEVGHYPPPYKARRKGINYFNWLPLKPNF